MKKSIVWIIILVMMLSFGCKTVPVETPGPTISEVVEEFIPQETEAAATPFPSMNAEDIVSIRINNGETGNEHYFSMKMDLSEAKLYAFIPEEGETYTAEHELPIVLDIKETALNGISGIIKTHDAANWAAIYDETAEDTELHDGIIWAKIIEEVQYVSVVYANGMEKEIVMDGGYAAGYNAVRDFMQTVLDSQGYSTYIYQDYPLGGNDYDLTGTKEDYELFKDEPENEDEAPLVYHFIPVGENLPKNFMRFTKEDFEDYLEKEFGYDEWSELEFKSYIYAFEEMTLDEIKTIRAFYSVEWRDKKTKEIMQCEYYDAYVMDIAGTMYELIFMGAEDDEDWFQEGNSRRVAESFDYLVPFDKDIYIESKYGAIDLAEFSLSCDNEAGDMLFDFVVSLEEESISLYSGENRKLVQAIGLQYFDTLALKDHLTICNVFSWKEDYNGPLDMPEHRIHLKYTDGGEKYIRMNGAYPEGYMLILQTAQIYMDLMSGQLSLWDDRLECSSFGMDIDSRIDWSGGVVAGMINLQSMNEKNLHMVEYHAIYIENGLASLADWNEEEFGNYFANVVGASMVKEVNSVEKTLLCGYDAYMVTEEIVLGEVPMGLTLCIVEVGDAQFIFSFMSSDIGWAKGSSVKKMIDSIDIYLLPYENKEDLTV